MLSPFPCHNRKLKKSAPVKYSFNSFCFIRSFHASYWLSPERIHAHFYRLPQSSRWHPKWNCHSRIYHGTATQRPFYPSFYQLSPVDRTFSAFHPGQYCQSFREHQRTLGIHLPQGLCKAFLIQLMNHRHCIQVGRMTVHYNFVVCIICEPCTMTQYMGEEARWLVFLFPDQVPTEYHIRFP